MVTQLTGLLDHHAHATANISVLSLVMPCDAAPDTHPYCAAVTAAVLLSACCCRYGGVVERLNIAAQADWYVYDIHVLLEALQ